MGLRFNAPQTKAPASWSTFALLLLAVGLQFQIVVPTGPVGLKVCPADVVAVLLAVPVIFHSLGNRAGPLCLSRTLPHWLAICTMVMTLSFAIGFLRLGHISMWALGSKLVGWGVLIAYLACGLFVGTVLGNHGRLRLARFLVYACIATGMLSVILSVVLAYRWVLPQELSHLPVRGFVDNRNAFIFLQMAAMTLLLAHGWARTSFVGGREREILCGTCGILIVYSGSRSGLPAAGLVLLLAITMGAMSPRSLLRSFLYALACGLALELARDLMQFHQVAKVENVGGGGASLLPLFAEPSALILRDTTAGSSDVQRLSSYWEALDLWLTAPVSGAGLGSALEASIAKHGTPLIIHNSALWLLAETGIVGLAAFVGLGYALTRPLFPLRRDDDGACFRLAAFLMLIAFAIMSLVHEMLYQRVLWLMLGLALAIPRAKVDKPCAD